MMPTLARHVSFESAPITRPMPTTTAAFDTDRARDNVTTQAAVVVGMRRIICAASALAAQCAIQISENIFDLFQPYRQTQQGGRNPGHLALLLALMGMNHRSGMGNERFHPTQAHGQHTD